MARGGGLTGLQHGLPWGYPQAVNEHPVETREGRLPRILQVGDTEILVTDQDALALAGDGDLSETLHSIVEAYPPRERAAAIVEQALS